eukprot:CAMPEP_0204327082 /NCGR_PEP_ID=MMETSP0469-20131031/12317_1 /ASSEMBLY_ACC=CAM_ASM_000384 /TAXON_ID=2969 /ORGANISM="Oxyrrhis marina" /LENGTH=190 /DNA_ID=CAMNT_0051309251 /DNA_START=29 /DNA_END=598 /DNA_ORIENTATION=+
MAECTLLHSPRPTEGKESMVAKCGDTPARDVPVGPDEQSELLPDGVEVQESRVVSCGDTLSREVPVGADEHSELLPDEFEVQVPYSNCRFSIRLPSTSNDLDAWIGHASCTCAAWGCSACLASLLAIAVAVDYTIRGREKTAGALLFFANCLHDVAILAMLVTVPLVLFRVMGWVYVAVVEIIRKEMFQS